MSFHTSAPLLVKQLDFVILHTDHLCSLNSLTLFFFFYQPPQKKNELSVKIFRERDPQAQYASHSTGCFLTQRDHDTSTMVVINTVRHRDTKQSPKETIHILTTRNKEKVVNTAFLPHRDVSPTSSSQIKHILDPERSQTSGQSNAY